MGIESLISGQIRTHFQAIEDGNARYFGMELHRDQTGGPRWAWQREVPIRRISRALKDIEIKYCGQFFTGVHMLLSHPSLWIFGCRRCSTVGEDAEWTTEEYKKSLSLV
jgi:hypothetical protein